MMDYTIDDVIFLPFTTRAFATGIPTVLAGSPTVEIYEDAGTTPIVEGAGKLVLTISLNSIAGFNMATATLSAANGFEAGKHYTLIVKTGTVDSVSVVGEVVGEFTIQRSAAAVDLANATDGLGAIKAETASILADTAEIGVAGAGLTEAGGTGDQLTAINLPNQTMDIVGNITGNLSGSVGSVTGAVGSVTGAVGSVTGNVGGNVVGSVASVTGAAGSVTGAVGSVTAAVTVGAVNAAGLADFFDTDSGTTYASAVAGSVVKEIADNAGGSALTEAGIADAVWDELLSGHVVSGSSGEALAAAGTAGDPWTTALPGAYGAGTAGKIIGDNINAPIATVDTVVDAIKAVTDNLPDSGALTTIDGNVDSILADTADMQPKLGTPAVDISADIAAVKVDSAAILVDTTEIGVAGAGLTNINLPDQAMNVTGNITGNLSGSVGSVTGAVGSVAGAVGSVTGNVTGSVGSLATQAKADVNAEVLDVLNTDTFSQPAQGAPGATVTLAYMLRWLYKLARNRVTQTATTISVYDDAATTVDHKSTHSDDGTTYDRGEFGTGP